MSNYLIKPEVEASYKSFELFSNENLQLHARINKTNKLIKEYCRFKCHEDIINCENEYCVIQNFFKTLSEV